MARSGVQVRGLSGLVSNFRAFDREVQERMREVVRENGEEQQALTRALAPKDTGFMASQTRLVFSPGGLTYTVGYDPADFLGAGRSFYPPFVIFGTSRMAGNNFLFHAHEAHAPKFTREAGEALRSAARSVAK